MERPGARLAGIVEGALLEPLKRHGYQLASCDETHRGGRAELTNGVISIIVHADWLEGELAVAIRAPGGVDVPVAMVVDELGAKGLRLSRLPRSASPAVIGSQLSKVAKLLLSQAADVLGGTEAGLARLEAVRPK